jgi:hypothetical protein
MRTNNGKLIVQGQQQLESEIINISHKQDQKYTLEIDAIKHRLTQLDKKCILLEESLSKQFNQFVIINVCSVLGLLFLLSSMQTNNEQSHQEASQFLSSQNQIKLRA